MYVQVLVERAVVGVLRIANRNLFRDNAVTDDVLGSLSLLLVSLFNSIVLFHVFAIADCYRRLAFDCPSFDYLQNLSPKAMFVFSRQIAYGLHTLLISNAANVHKKFVVKFAFIL